MSGRAAGIDGFSPSVFESTLAGVSAQLYPRGVPGL